MRQLLYFLLSFAHITPFSLQTRKQTRTIPTAAVDSVKLCVQNLIKFVLHISWLLHVNCAMVMLAVHMDVYVCDTESVHSRSDLYLYVQYATGRPCQAIFDVCVCAYTRRKSNTTVYSEKVLAAMLVLHKIYPFFILCLMGDDSERVSWM